MSYQASGVGVNGVRGVDKLGGVLGVLGKLLVVLEPAVDGCRETLVLQTPELGGRAHRDRLRHAAPGHHGFDCAQHSMFPIDWS